MPKHRPSAFIKKDPRVPASSTAKTLDAHARSIANLRKGAVPISSRYPALTPETARTLVTLIMAGVPDVEAIRLVDPSTWKKLTDHAKPPFKTRQAWVEDWLDSKLLLDAFDRYNEVEWVKLSNTERATIALEKHKAELAYYLATHNYATDGRTGDAREALLRMLKADEDADQTSKLTDVVRELLDRTGNLAKPPVMDTVELDPGPEPEFDSEEELDPDLEPDSDAAPVRSSTSSPPSKPPRLTKRTH